MQRLCARLLSRIFLSPNVFQGVQMVYRSTNAISGDIYYVRGQIVFMRTFEIFYSNVSSTVAHICQANKSLTALVSLKQEEF